jgi:hypothetical protein
MDEDRPKIVDASRNFGDLAGHYVRIQRSRTRWQRFKHWLSVRVLRRPDPDVMRITSNDSTTLFVEGLASGLKEGDPAAVVKRPS